MNQTEYFNELNKYGDYENKILSQPEPQLDPLSDDDNYHCRQCGRVMNPIDYIIGVVCMKCCKENHRRALGKRSLK